MKLLLHIFIELLFLAFLIECLFVIVSYLLG